jgi:phi13 family phage major tail protein
MLNYKSYVGVDQVYYALVTQDDESAYAAGAPAYLAPVMNVAQAPKGASKTQYADNQPFDTMSSEGETELDVEITGLPNNVEAIILGKVWDEVNDRFYDNGGQAPYVALGFRAKKSDGTYRYYWFLKGQFAPPSEEQATQTDAPDPKGIKLKFTAVRTVYEFDLDGGTTVASVKRVKGDTADAGFSATGWFTSVQVPNAGTPSAITCTPDPADAAAGVAVGKTITLTFNNPLAGGAEDGIILTTDAGVVKACARTLNAARTVVTLDPTTNLAALTTYLIIVPGVTDIYGQSFADTVYDFTTA